ncbi:MAG: 50S ribosomal protein L7/L12 [Alloprevotella tannerae]|nr:50S ribosomal protein L7/L12 [Alloprevotella tannerae]
MFAQPITTMAQTEYNFQIGDVKVNSDNYTELSKIDGVSGSITFDPTTNTLTLDNATIKTDQFVGIVINTTIKMVLLGNNSITSTERMGIMNNLNGNLTITGGGTLKVKGADQSNGIGDMMGIGNWGIITVSECTLEASGEVAGLYGGFWKFDRCNVRAKGNGLESNPYYGSICWMWDELPKFEGCKITSPATTNWEKFEDKGYSYFTLFGSDNKSVTDWVTISTDDISSISNVTVTTALLCGIYNLYGVRRSGELKNLPKGVYIVNGRKVVK